MDTKSIICNLRCNAEIRSLAMSQFGSFNDHRAWCRSALTTPISPSTETTSKCFLTTCLFDYRFGCHTGLRGIVTGKKYCWQTRNATATNLDAWCYTTVDGEQRLCDSDADCVRFMLDPHGCEKCKMIKNADDVCTAA